jgi:hypothetical protein
MALRPALVLLATVPLVLCGCASDAPQVMTSFDPLESFPGQATFVWDDSASKLPQDERLRELDLDQLIKQAADEAFAVRGYRRVASAPADYRLSYQVGENVWHGAEGVTSVVSVSLVLSDPKNGRHVWLGFARAEVQPGLSRTERARRVRRTFDQLLAEFPPRR